MNTSIQWLSQYGHFQITDPSKHEMGRIWPLHRYIAKPYPLESEMNGHGHMFGHEFGLGHGHGIF